MKYKTIKKFERKAGKFFDALDNHCILISRIIFVSAILIGGIFQFVAFKLPENSVVVAIEKWLQSHSLENLLKLFDGFALVVGGISFFIEEWAADDDEHKTYLFSIVLSLAVAHVFDWIGWHFVVLIVSFSNILLLLIPYSIFIFKSTMGSTKRAERLEKKKLKEMGK